MTGDIQDLTFFSFFCCCCCWCCCCWCCCSFCSWCCCCCCFCSWCGCCFCSWCCCCCYNFCCCCYGCCFCHIFYLKYSYNCCLPDMRDSMLTWCKQFLKFLASTTPSAWWEYEDCWKWQKKPRWKMESTGALTRRHRPGMEWSGSSRVKRFTLYIYSQIMSGYFIVKL